MISIRYNLDKLYFGYQPTATDVIEVQYRVCSGTQSNGVKAFSVDAGAIGAV